MGRYIVIDNKTGLIVGDTAIFETTNTVYEDLFTACRYIDDERGIKDRSYHEQTIPFGRADPGYLVYLASDEDDKNIIPVITDFEDQSQIRMVKRYCRLHGGGWYIEEDD